MASWPSMPRIGVTAAVAALTTLLLTPGATAAPSPVDVPGGLTPTQATRQLATVTRAQASTGCIADGANVCIVKATTGPSCTGYASQTTPPSTIRVLVHTPSIKIVTVSFLTYVENVLPNEWVPSWDGDALKAGAVAVKSYGWYWVTHYGGYLKTKSPSTCFDVTDDNLFQVYKAGSATTRTNSAVLQSWPVAARVGGQVIQASYRAYLRASTETCGSDATGAVLSQWGSQNCVEESTGNKYNVILQAYYFPGLQLATTRQRRTAHDFTFEQTSTRATFTAGHWLFDDGYGTHFAWGQAGDVPVITDGGDGFAHAGVWRPSNGTWYLAGPTGRTASRLQWGLPGDIPVPGHYAGSTKASVPAVFRPSTQLWYVYGRPAVTYGLRTDVPVPGDYDGDGTTDVAMWRPSNGMWYVRGQGAVQYGWRGDIPVPADYDGDGKTDVAVYRPANHTWYVRGIGKVVWGLAGDVPVTGDFTGDGKADFTMYRPSTRQWYTHGQASVVFGPAGATPVGAGTYSQ